MPNGDQPKQPNSEIDPSVKFSVVSGKIKNMIGDADQKMGSARERLASFENKKANRHALQKSSDGLGQVQRELRAAIDEINETDAAFDVQKNEIIAGINAKTVEIQELQNQINEKLSISPERALQQPLPRHDTEPSPPPVEEGEANRIERVRALLLEVLSNENVNMMNTLSQPDFVIRDTNELANFAGALRIFAHTDRDAERENTYRELNNLIGQLEDGSDKSTLTIEFDNVKQTIMQAKKIAPAIINFNESLQAYKEKVAALAAASEGDQSTILDAMDGIQGNLLVKDLIELDAIGVSADISALHPNFSDKDRKGSNVAPWSDSIQNLVSLNLEFDSPKVWSNIRNETCDADNFSATVQSLEAVRGELQNLQRSKPELKDEIQIVLDQVNFDATVKLMNAALGRLRNPASPFPYHMGLYDRRRVTAAADNLKAYVEKLKRELGVAPAAPTADAAPPPTPDTTRAAPPTAPPPTPTPRSATPAPRASTPAPRTPTPRPAPAPAPAPAPGAPSAPRVDTGPAAPAAPSPEAREPRPIEIPPDLLIELIGAGNLQRIMGMFAEGKEIGAVETAMSTLLDGALEDARKRTIEPVLQAAGFADFEEFRERWKAELHKQVAALLAEHIKWQVEQAVEADETFQKEKRQGSLAVRLGRALLHAAPAVAVGGAYGAGLLALGWSGPVALAVAGAGAKVVGALMKRAKKDVEQKRLEQDAVTFESIRKEAEEKVRERLAAEAKQEGSLRLASVMSVLLAGKGPRVGEDFEMRNLRLQRDVASVVAKMANEMAEGDEAAMEFARAKAVERFLAHTRLRNARARQKYEPAPALLEKKSYWTQAMEELKKSGTLEAWQESRYSFKDWRKKESWQEAPRQLLGYFWTGVTGGSAGAAIGYAGAAGIWAKAAARFGVGAVGGGVSRFGREYLAAKVHPTELLNKYLASVEKRDPKEAALLREKLEAVVPKKLSTKEQAIAVLKSAAATGGVAAGAGLAFDELRESSYYKDFLKYITSVGASEPTEADIRAGAKSIGELPKEVLANGKTAEAATRAVAEAKASSTIIKPIESVKLTSEQLPAALEGKLGFNPIVGKGEGISTGPMMRDIAVHPERLEAYKDIKGIQQILTKHADGSQLTEAEIKRAAGLIYRHDFGQQDLRVEQAGKVAVVFDQTSGRYQIGTLDGSKIEAQLYTESADNSRKAVPVGNDRLITKEEIGDKGWAEAVRLARERGLIPSEEVVASEKKVDYASEDYIKEAMKSQDKTVNTWADLAKRGPIETSPEVLNESKITLGKKIPFAGELAAEAKWTPDALQKVATGVPEAAAGSGGVSATSTKPEFGAAVPEGAATTVEPAPEAQSEVGSETVAEEIRKRYDDVYVEAAAKWVDALRADKFNFETIPLDDKIMIGGRSQDFVRRIDGFLANLSVNRPIDTSNLSLMNLLNNDNALESDILTALQKDVIHHLPADIRQEARILLAENEPDHLYLDTAKPAHAFKFVDKDGTPYFYYDSNYTFGEGDDGKNLVKIIDADGKVIQQITPELLTTTTTRSSTITK